MDFKVQIDNYSGPLDLLLHLIRRTEVDIWSVPITTIASQFMEQVEALQQEGHLKLEDAGEFVVLAATLLELKTEMLLPVLQKPGEDEESDDPGFGLVRQLIEFKRYRDLAQVLEQQRHRQARCFARPDGLIPEAECEDVFLDEVSTLDLYRAFSSLVLETKLDLRTIVYDDRPIEEVIEELREQLPLGQWFALRELLEEQQEQESRSSLISLFLATLELTRQQECEIDQQGSEIYLRRTEKPEAADEAEASDPSAHAAETAQTESATTAAQDDPREEPSPDKA